MADEPPDPVVVVVGSDGLATTLRNRGLRVRTAVDVGETRDLVSSGVDCVVGGRRHPATGVALFDVARDLDPDLPVLLVDADGVVAARNGDRPPGPRIVGALADSSPAESDGRIRDGDGVTGAAAGVPRYDRIVETLGDPIYMLDEDGVLTYVNEATTALLGRPETEVVGEHFDRFLPPDDAETSDEVVATLLAEGGTDATFEMAVLDEEGDLIPVENHLAVRRRDGEFVGTIGVLRDITERKRRENDLQQYETIVHALADPVYATDAEGYFTFVNPTFEQVTGYPAAEVLGEPMHFEDVVAPGDVDRIRDLVGWLLSGDGDRTRGTVEIEVQSRDGRTIPVEDSVALLPFEEEFRGAAGVLRDVSDRRQEQQRLEVMNRILRHNVRNQMNVIAGSAETILEMTERPTVSNVARSIVEASEELTAVSDNVRDLQAAIDREDEATVDLVALTARVVAEARENYPDAAIVADSPDELVVDAGESLAYAIEHVVENAIEHHEDSDPRVLIAVESTDDGWGRVRITDDGPGIPEQDRAVITGEVEADPLQHGSGLGLWIVNWVVESFDGRVEIDKPSDGGTVVSILLPRA